MDMATNHDTDALDGVPKTTTQQQSLANTPPPAYTPPRPHSLNLAALAALEIQQSQSQSHTQSQQQPHPSFQLVRPLWTTLLGSTAEDQDQDDGAAAEGISPISLRINTSVSITRSNNIVCLAATPADHANAIAQAVVQAIQKNSSGQCGIPMIDEDGRPRPVNIEVDASMVVEGSGNVVGGQDVVAQALRSKDWAQGLGTSMSTSTSMGLRRRRDDGEAEAESSQAQAKRRRSSS